MGIKMLRGTMGRNRRGLFSRDLIDFETRFERVWPEHNGVVPARLDSQVIPGNAELEEKNKEETLEGGMERI